MTAVIGPGCDRGDGDGSSGFSSRLLRRPKLPSWLAFASQPEQGTGGVVGGGGDGGGGGGGGGGDAGRSCRWLLVLCGDGSDSKWLLTPKTVSWELLFRPIATQNISWDALFTHRNELLHDPLEPLHPQNASWELVSTIRNERCQRLASLSALPPLEFFKESGRI